MHLARAQRGAPAVGERDHQAPGVVDARGPSASAGPRDVLPAQRVAGAIGRQQRHAVERQRALDGGEQALERRLEVGRGQPQRARGGVQLGGQLLDAQRDVDADPEHGPALVRAPLGQDPGHLATVDEHVVGPLDQCGWACDLGHGQRRRERQQRRRIAQDERQQQRSAGRGGPRPPLASASGALLAGRDQRPVRRAVLRQRAGAVVGRRRDAQVQPRAAEPHTHAGRIWTSASRSSPRCNAAEPRLTASASVR